MYVIRIFGARSVAIAADEVEETEDLWQDDEGKEEDSQFLETSTTTKKLAPVFSLGSSIGRGGRFMQRKFNTLPYQKVHGIGTSCKSTSGQTGICKYNFGKVEKACGKGGRFIVGKCSGPAKVQCCLLPGGGANRKLG